MSEIQNVSIKIQPGVYNQFRNLNNKVWFALGEYVDNAVQSFENNKNLLKDRFSNQYQFQIHITIEFDTIMIKDNAAGIDYNNFLRAFEPGNTMKDTSGLSEFGMGLKTASIWLADIWSVKTSALGEKESRFVEFDLDKVIDEEYEQLSVLTELENEDEHYTIITLKKLSKNAPSSHQLDKIKRHLTSIYRKFIRSGDLELYINDERMLYVEPEILKAPYYNSPNGISLLWKKEIKFKIDKYTATGFIGLLSTMSSMELNGLSLFRRGRVIEGSHDQKYRPKVICGQPGSPRYKRIFGEIELEGFAVSFNKGSFQEQEDLEMLMEAIQKEISAKEFDLYTQGEKYIKPKTQEDNIRVGKNLVTALKKANKPDEIKEKINHTIDRPDDIGEKLQKAQVIKNALVIDSIEEIIPIKDNKFKLITQFVTEKTIEELYTLSIEDDELFTKRYIFKINLAHRFFIKFDKFKTEEDYQPVVTIIKSLVLSEIIAPFQGVKNAGIIRKNINDLLQNL
jgi:hypothetical protein